MTKKILFAITCLYFFTANADAPGKIAIADSKITFKNISKQTDYNFYWKGDYDSARAFNIDSTFIIPGSGGKPMDAMVWAVSKKTNRPTDTLFFSNYYDPDYIITVDTITGTNKILYSKDQVSNSNAGGVFGDNSNDTGTNHSTKIILFSAISLIALILLVWFFIRRKNTQNL